MVPLLQVTLLSYQSHPRQMGNALASAEKNRVPLSADNEHRNFPRDFPTPLIPFQLFPKPSRDLT